MLLAVALQLAPVAERDLFTKPQTPKRVREVIQTPFPAVVLFVGEPCAACGEARAALGPVAQKLRGVAPFVLINCSLNSSAKFCAEKRVDAFPAMVMYNQDEQKSVVPVQWDMDDELTEKAVIEWVYEYRRNVFSTSPKAEAIIDFLDALGKRDKNVTIIYTTKGVWPPVFFSRVAIHFLGRANNIHQAGFDAGNLERLQALEGGELLKEGRNIAVYADKRLAVYEGEMTSEAVIQWVEQRFFGKAKDEN